MLEIALFTVGIAAVALFLQERFSVPLPVTIIVGIIELQLFGTALGHPPTRISEEDFDQLTYLALPILICSDALALRWDEIRRNAISLTYVAGIMIVLSVGLGILLNRLILPDYDLTAPMMAALMCMVLATDPDRLVRLRSLQAAAQPEGHRGGREPVQRCQRADRVQHRPDLHGDGRGAFGQRAVHLLVPDGVRRAADRPRRRMVGPADPALHP